jgi:hypothetical protein
MRIYMAGVYVGRNHDRNAGNLNTDVTNNYKYPWVLESYHYIRKGRAVRDIRDDGQNIFLDSGAFSMFTQGIQIDAQTYANFIRANNDIFHIYANLDAIGEDKEQETYDRQKQLERMLGNEHPILPVHHVRDADDWLRRYIDEGYDYIALGGMVPESTDLLREWLDHVWHHYLTNPDGTAKIKVHGFGLTVEQLMFRYPWYSVDSTSWVMASRFGSVYIDVLENGNYRDYKVAFSNRSPKKFEMDSWHFLALPPDDQEMIRQRLEQLDPDLQRYFDDQLRSRFKDTYNCELKLTPEALGRCYGLRDFANMEYFRRAQNRRVDRFLRVQDTLF